MGDEILRLEDDGGRIPPEVGTDNADKANRYMLLVQKRCGPVPDHNACPVSDFVPVWCVARNGAAGASGDECHGCKHRVLELLRKEEPRHPSMETRS